MNKQETIIIVGGLSAGPSAAAKARRMNENARILLFEKTDYISYATCGIPYTFSNTIQSREKLLVVKPNLLENRFGVEMHLNEPVMDILPDQHQVITSAGTYAYDKLIFATGARAFVPEIKNLELTQDWSNVRSMADFDKVYNGLDAMNDIVVLGAGLIGIEAAENLAKAGKKVTVVELAPSVLAAWDAKFGYFAEQALNEGGVDVITGEGISEVVVEEGKLKAVIVGDRTIPADYLMTAVGGRPNTEMLKDKGAETLSNGALVVNDKMETSLADIYAAGDNVSIKNLINGEAGYFPMGTHSNKGGRVAGANAVGGNERFPGAYGTAIVKVFDYTLARTGFNERALKMREIPYQSTLIIAGATPGFYPNPKDLIVEIYYDPTTGTLLGAEVFGEKGADKRIDVLSTAIYAKLTVHDLPNLDLAYAPPFSPAKDPVIVAGYTASNTLKFVHEEISPRNLTTFQKETPSEDYQLVDVRNPQELANQGQVPGAINIPLDQLRERINELDPAKQQVIYCQKGLRGYLASMILVNSGFTKVKNVQGGFFLYKKSGYEVVPQAVNA
ncbi:FAD-dependent oxidoreductase [Persicobacter sp. CCB-QB2]|uniref:FAD-dependent oxidoreductase n=1 Tax=Persicobacter sp. CCB-QB2 TaxID=1561025 RepID=UPI0006A98988|nr:FAD-dependent oxidoreductase [Persicobacter sp. CCB-QB2]